MKFLPPVLEPETARFRTGPTQQLVTPVGLTFTIGEHGAEVDYIGPPLFRDPTTETELDSTADGTEDDRQREDTITT